MPRTSHATRDHGPCRLGLGLAMAAAMAAPGVAQCAVDGSDVARGRDRVAAAGGGVPRQRLRAGVAAARGGVHDRAAGCTRYVAPDVVDLVVTATGTASVDLVIPNTPSLAGAVFRHQMVPLALDPTLAVTATNALAMTAGSF